MYNILRKLNGLYECSARTQDSTEYWECLEEREAYSSLIKFARITNGVLINKTQITLLKEAEYNITKYNITKEECELLVKIREGDVFVVKGTPPWGTSDIYEI